ncbi:hypothetical protein QYE76_034368 [Lolium multiflorum]|uniref:Uncharacterized protein n=1 Tax=Lolium multiflorum TaxID=4521 RepID=A0AAD8QX15_LOLMU|nr:hypothetical protein QYE76_034368 [Lolium multiflorum]
MADASVNGVSPSSIRSSFAFIDEVRRLSIGCGCAQLRQRWPTGELKHVEDPEALEATRKEMLATAKKLANTAAALRDERAEAAEKQFRLAESTSPRLRRAAAAGNPKGQHAQPAELLKKKDEEVDINYL